ncbi:malectin domain-containing carbohydrate-binding protein [Variovorax sp. LjRoot84]|uniref:malectin domain-containing carbohydrate-binding protein n=1 Tax=Variovorax sp. LjRoot84 TaxID=3342340 RepID=UPI003ECC47E6
MQFGPDGRLYIAQQDGLLRIYDVTQPAPGQWSAVQAQTLGLIQSIPNHNDDGSLNTSITDRQVTGILVAGTAANPVIYVTSSDPRIAEFGDLNLDTNSGILSKLTWNGASWTKVDLIRGLPRSEENHSPNGMALSADGTKLYLVQGGNTNNGAPSSFFSNTPEYALSAAVLEIDLVALEAIPNKVFTYAPGVTSTYKYDLPTLDDPTVSNNGTTGNETAGGLDVGGPFGGNDGLNQAILPADAPLRIFATGLRNAFDAVLTQSGELFTIDNGSNGGLGGVPILDANGKPTNQFNNDGPGSLDSLYLLADGSYYGHPDPTRGNQTGSVLSYADGSQPQVIATIPNAAAAVPSGVQIAPGFVIDPSKFTSSAARLAQEGQFTAGQQSLAQFGASTNGLMEYTATSFNGEIKGDLITASFDGTLKLIQLAPDGVTVQGVTTLATLGGTPLDLVQGPGGSIWVALIGADQIVALTPSDQASGSDPDMDDDGLLNTVDPFQADAANGFGTFLASNASLNWNFQFGAGDSAPGPDGLFLGLTGHMANGTRDFVAPVAEGGLDLTNVKIGTAAGGGLVVVEEVSTGTASGSGNTGEFVFQTGVVLAPDVQTFNVKWTAVNPFPGLPTAPTVREIGGFIGTGDQSNFLKVVAGPNGMLFQLESNGAVIASQTLNAPGVATAPASSNLVFELLVNRATSQATPSVTYTGSSGPVKVTGNAINLAGTSILTAINGDYAVQGKDSGLAVGLWSSNTGEGSQNTFQASFDDILITSTGPTSQLVKAVNVGGGQVTASDGVVFQADAGPTTGASQVFSTAAGIAGTTDDALYQDERWTPGGSYTYEVPVANGTYQVDLLMAEIYAGITGPGQRVFDMSLEGQALAPLQNIDIYAQVGANAAYTISQQATVSDGSLSIQVGPGSSSPGNVENAKLNAFAVYSTAAPTSPTLSIAAANASLNEGNSGSTAFTFTVSRTGSTAGASTAAFAVTGSGANPATAADFTGGVFPTGTVSFAAGETSKTITVNIAGDSTVEPSEDFTVALSNPSAGTTIGTAAATGTILNDDTAPEPSLSIAAANASLNEGNSGSTAFTFTVTRTGSTTGASTASYAVAGSGANPATAADFTGGAFPTGTVSFAAGETTKTITVNVAGDATVESNENFTVTLSNPSAGTSIGTTAATSTILNDDGAATPTLVAAVNVGGGQVTASDGVVFQADAGPTTGASQVFSTAAGIAGTTDDALYQDERWTPGGSYTYEVPVANGTYQVDLLMAEIYAGITGPGQRVFDMSLEGQALAPLQNIDIYAQVGANAAYTISQQATVSDGSLSIQVGPGSSSPGNVENAKLNAFAVYSTAAPTSPTLSIAAANASLNEGNSGSTAFTFTVSRTGSTAGASTAAFAVTGSGANPATAADFTGGVFPTGTVSFAAGEATKTITVNVAGDSTVEPAENFTVTLSNPSAGTAIGSAAAAGTILNDDTAPEPSLSIAAANASLNEGNSGSTAFTFTVTRTGSTTGASTASYAVAGSDANPATAADFTGGAFPTGTVSFAAGETTKTITVNVAGDATVESNENFTVTLSNPSAGTSIGTTAATSTILNDDSSATPTLVTAVNVGGGQVTASNGVVFQADAGPTTGASQVFSTAAGIAGTTDDALYQDERWTPGGSYTYEVPVANGTYQVDLLMAEIYAGITGPGQRVFDMSLEGQALAPLQNIDIYAQVGANAAYTISQQATVSDGSLSIQVGPGSSSPGNVENAKLNAFAVYSTAAPTSPTLSIAAANASLNEGNSGSTAFTFTVTRTGSTTGASTASYAVTGSGANPATAADFTGGVFPTGTVSFAAGEATKTITVNVAGDSTVEPAENFTVTLSNPSAGTAIGSAAAAGTILNDDSSGGAASARLLITPGTTLNASTFAEPAYELTNTGTTAIRTLTIDLHNSLIAGTVFDPFGTFGDTTALDFTPYGSVPVSATWAYGPNPVTEGGYKTLVVTFGGAGLAAGQTFAFRLDADPASIEGPAPGPNESGSISGFEHIGASVTVGTVDGGSLGGEVFTQGSAGGGMATLSSSLLPAAPVLSMSTAGGTPLVTDAVGGILKANLPGLNAGAGSPGNDVVVEISGTAGQTVRLAASEIGGVGMDIPLGSHEGNTVLQNPSFVDVTLGAGGTASVALALPAPTSGLAPGSVSGRFAVTAAAIDPATGAATSQVSSTLVVKDAATSFTSEAASDTFMFRQGFATTEVFQFSATGGSHDFIGLDQDLFPGMTLQQVLNSNALQPGAGAGDVDIVPAAGGEIHLHDSSGQLTVDVLRANPQDFFFF